MCRSRRTSPLSSSEHALYATDTGLRLRFEARVGRRWQRECVVWARGALNQQFGLVPLNLRARLQVVADFCGDDWIMPLREGRRLRC